MNTYGWALVVLVISIVSMYGYVFVVRDWLQYRRARKEIFEFVKARKRRCTGNNRFLVTVEALQDSFRIYNTNIILNVWLDLVKERVIEQDPQDQEWCIR